MQTDFVQQANELRKKEENMVMNNWLGRLAALACAMALSGCLAIPVSGGTKVSKPIQTERRLVPLPGKVEFYPAAERNGNRVEVRLMVEGSFTEETVERRPYEVTEQRKVSFGILPGMASLRPGLAPGGTLLALWFNICFLGTPTLNGLLLEPFNPEAVPKSTTIGDGHVFRRSAFVGFHKYYLPGRQGEDPPRTSQRTVSDTRRVEDDVELQFSAQPKFWKTLSRKNGLIVLEGVEPGEHTGTLVLESVPQGHWLQGELKDLVNRRWFVSVKAE